MRLLLAALPIAILGAQTDPAPEALLAAIRRNMQANLARLPNYTCQLTIERSLRLRDSHRFRPIDTVRMEVGYVEGKELYAWPGQKFGDSRLDELMPAGGAVGSGDFALHVNSIFRGNAAIFTYAGPGEEDGRPAIRFDYRVPQSKSKYILLHGGDMAVVGYHGSFWVDAGTLLLLRLEVEAEDIPAKLKTTRAGSVLTYARTRIGGSEFLLPRSSELAIVDDTGDESRNLTRFEQCREYQGESVVSFAEPADLGEAPRPVTEVQLPGGLYIEMILETGIDGARAAIGDPVTAVVAHEVVKAGEVLIPKGARVTGRITRLAEMTGGRVPYRLAGLELSTLEFADRRAQFRATLENLGFAGTQFSLASGPRTLAPQHGKQAAYGLQPGEGVIIVKGNVLRIPAGVHMYWRTMDRRK